jgi:hypothetical protein
VLCKIVEGLLRLDRGVLGSLSVLVLAIDGGPSLLMAWRLRLGWSAGSIRLLLRLLRLSLLLLLLLRGRLSRGRTLRELVLLSSVGLLRRWSLDDLRHR